MATFIVNTTLDESDGDIFDGDVSLRDAVAAANASAGADVVRFDAAVFNGQPGDILRLTQGQIGISDALTIDGGAGVTITGDANGDDVTLAGGITDVAASQPHGPGSEDRLDDNSRIFDATADLTLDGLTLTGGSPGGEEAGGAVRSTAALTLIDSMVSGNHAEYVGGGIYGLGSVTVIDSTIRGNSIEDFGAGGGIVGGTVTVTNSTVSDNYAGYESGAGGILGDSVTVTNSTISGNSASGSGGGIFGGQVTVTDSVVSGNYAYGGGGIAGGTVTVTDTEVSGNYSYRFQGGGISGGTVIVTNSTISGNSIGGSFFAYGGGISGLYNVTVTDSTVTSNSASDRGGGIYGGGNVTVTNSTISDNRAEGGYAYGGGIDAGTVTVTNSTISGNYAGQYGGGILGGTVTVSNSTISGNIAAGYGTSYSGVGGGGIYGRDVVTLTNSLVLGNATTYAGIGGDEVQAGALVRTGGNIVGTDVFSGGTDVGNTTAAAVFSATAEIAPGVFAGVLADNGGPTETIALRLAQGNPAIGGADPATATATDQRGVARDADPDLGAFEAGPVGPPAAFRVKAEALTRVAGFKVESLGAASGGKVIKAPNASVEAHAKFTFTGQDGTYDLDLGHFDENDGQASLALLVDGVELDSFVFDEHLGSANANARTRAVRHIADVTIETGDLIELVGHGDGGEQLRIDYLDFTPAPPPPQEPFRIEAETLTRVAGFKVESLGLASDGKVIRSPDAAVEAHAKFTFTGQDGLYDLDLGHFDENDGQASLAVRVDGVEIDSWVFDQHLGSSNANAKTRAVHHIADVAIETGDVIELIGRGNGGEPLRTDYLDFTYVDDLIA